MGFGPRVRIRIDSRRNRIRLFFEGGQLRKRNSQIGDPGTLGWLDLVYNPSDQSGRIRLAACNDEGISLMDPVDLYWTATGSIRSSIGSDYTLAEATAYLRIKCLDGIERIESDIRSNETKRYGVPQQWCLPNDLVDDFIALGWVHSILVCPTVFEVMAKYHDVMQSVLNARVVREIHST